MNGKAIPPKHFIMKYLYLKDKHKFLGSFQVREGERMKSENYSRATDLENNQAGFSRMEGF